jgi:hypothetical protein
MTPVLWGRQGLLPEGLADAERYEAPGVQSRARAPAGGSELVGILGGYKAL